MSFGFSVGDFIAATTLATTASDLLTGSEEKGDRDSIIILSFRSLQAQRIKELQEELLRISQRRVEILQATSLAGNVTTGVPAPTGLHGERDITVVRDINSDLDVLLNHYGLCFSLELSFHIRIDESVAEAIRNYETLSQEPLDTDALGESRFRSFKRTFFGLRKSKYSVAMQNIQTIIENPNLRPNFRELNKGIREAKIQKQAFSERIWMGALGGVR